MPISVSVPVGRSQHAVMGIVRFFLKNDSFIAHRSFSKERTQSSRSVRLKFSKERQSSSVRFVHQQMNDLNERSFFFASERSERAKKFWKWTFWTARSKCRSKRSFVPFNDGRSLNVGSATGTNERTNEENHPHHPMNGTSRTCQLYARSLPSVPFNEGLSWNVCEGKGTNQTTPGMERAICAFVRSPFLRSFPWKPFLERALG